MRIKLFAQCAVLSLSAAAIDLNGDYSAMD